MLGLRGEAPTVGPTGVFPVMGPLNIKVMSMDLLLPSDELPVMWRGPLKMGALRQFIADAIRGELNILFVDSPQEVGDESLSIAQMLQLGFAVIVTIPSEVSKLVVKKVVTSSKTLNATHDPIGMPKSLWARWKSLEGILNHPNLPQNTL